MYQPWVGHWFPGLTPGNMIELSLSVYVGLYDYAQEQQKNRMPGR
jgi:hypothetical protein